MPSQWVGCHHSPKFSLGLKSVPMTFSASMTFAPLNAKPMNGLPSFPKFSLGLKSAPMTFSASVNSAPLDAELIARKGDYLQHASPFCPSFTPVECWRLTTSSMYGKLHPSKTRSGTQLTKVSVSAAAAANDEYMRGTAAVASPYSPFLHG